VSARLTTSACETQELTSRSLRNLEARSPAYTQYAEGGRTIRETPSHVSAAQPCLSEPCQKDSDTLFRTVLPGPAACHPTSSHRISQRSTSTSNSHQISFTLGVRIDDCSTSTESVSTAVFAFASVCPSQPFVEAVLFRTIVPCTSLALLSNAAWEEELTMTRAIRVPA
jgi:hypothetical protein